jgi:hypothetical protein
LLQIDTTYQRDLETYQMENKMIITRCSCGFSVETETSEEGYKITHQHFLDNINTHTISTIVGEAHMHMPKKKSWIKKTLSYLKENRFLV